MRHLQQKANGKHIVNIFFFLSDFVIALRKCSRVLVPSSIVLVLGVWSCKEVEDETDYKDDCGSR